MNFCLQTVSSFGNEALQLFCLEPCPQTHRQSPGQDTQHPLQPPPHPPHHHHHHHTVHQTCHCQVCLGGNIMLFM